MVTFLQAHYADIENIYYRHFAAWMRRAGLDQEDGLQAVLLAIQVRDHGACSFDRRRSSLGHYIYLIARQQVAGLVRAAHRRRDVEVLGGLGYVETDEDGTGDIAEQAATRDNPETIALAEEAARIRLRRLAGTVPA